MGVKFERRASYCGKCLNEVAPPLRCCCWANGPGLVFVHGEEGTYGGLRCLAPAALCWPNSKFHVHASVPSIAVAALRPVAKALPTLSAVHTSCLQSVKWAALASGSSIAATRPAGRDGGEVGLISTARARAA